jgi:uncharacterized membrane protein YgdD (TMEM256/DUF423 family)
MERTFILLGSILSALAVAFGAFGAHGLKAVVSTEMLANFETGARYHFYHALAMFAVAFVASRFPNANLANIAGWLFLIGVALFSGSLYAMTLTGQRWLGAITPIGGVAFIAGWVCLALAMWRS